MLEIEKAASADKLNKYYELKVSYGNEPGFYFDAAQYLFEKGFKKNALDILLNATEISDGNSSILRAIGYTLENWKYFDEAIKVYGQLLELDSNDLYSYRDLAWAFYQNGNYQRAVDLLYDAITLNTESGEFNNLSFKSLLLNEMNAMISIHKEVLDLSKIPAVLIRPLPSNLRIVLDCNKQDLQNIIIREPGGAECSTTNTVSKNGGFIVRNQYNHYRDNGYYYSYMGPIDYQIKNAREGKYKIRIDYSAYNYYDYKFSGHIPTFIRITSFKDFGNPNQAIFVENVNVDNQAGIIEIGEIKW